MGSVLVAFGVVFLAELGDKSQLMTLAFAARERWTTVLLGLFLAVGSLNLLAVTVGAVVADRLPTPTISVVAGLAFLGFAAWTLLGDDEDTDDAADGAIDTDGARSSGERPAVLRVAGAFFVAELGDKTQLATVTLAAQRSAVAVWVGATAAILAANVVALVVGRWLHRRLPAHLLRYGAAALFALFGAWMIVDGLTG